LRRLRFRLLPLLAAMVTLAAVTVVQAGPASANESAPTLSPAQGPAGTRVTAAASDWIGCTSMSVSGWGSTLATTTINSSGAFSLSFAVPASAAGDQQLQFSPTCSHSTWMPFVTFKVTTPGSTDTSAPSVSWTSPVGNSGTFPVSSGSVTLQASASDNVGVARVKFTRWDAVAGKWVDLATVSSAPWQTTLAVSTLNSGYNQVNVQAWDAAGNASTSPYIWLNRTVAPFDAFLAKNSGKFLDFDGAYGAQCVDLVQYWSQAIGGPRFTGNYAKDLYKQTANFYTWIDKIGAAVPQKGDIVVWSGTYNGGPGHVGIATGNGTKTFFEVFEQNDPTGSNSHLKTYSTYTSVLGWLRPPSTAVN